MAKASPKTRNLQLNGFKNQQIRAMNVLKYYLAVFTIPERVSKKIMRKLRSGIVRLPIKVMPQPNITLALCIVLAMVLVKIITRQ